MYSIATLSTVAILGAFLNTGAVLSGVHFVVQNLDAIFNVKCYC